MGSVNIGVESCQGLQPASLNPAAASATPLEVLLVEDNAGDTLMIYEAAKASSIPVHLHLARDADQALLIVGDHTFDPDLVILDLNLPGESGFSVLEHWQSSNLPVVVFTGSSDAAAERHALDLGARAFVTKPANFQAYQDAVRGIIARWARRGPMEG